MPLKEHALHKPILNFRKFCVAFSLSLIQNWPRNFARDFVSPFSYHAATTHTYTTRCQVRCVKAIKLKIALTSSRNYVSAGVGDVAAVLPVVEPRVQSHFFLDKPCISSIMSNENSTEYQTAKGYTLHADN